MKVLLTAFGRDYRVAPLDDDEASFFYRLPPVRFRPGALDFQPDIYAFIVAESVIIDGNSFEKLTRRADPAYRTVTQFFEIAKSEGLLQVADFESTLNERKNVLHQMIERDLVDIDGWIPIVNESTKIWQELSVTGMNAIHTASERTGLSESLVTDRSVAMYLRHAQWSPRSLVHSVDFVYRNLLNDILSSRNARRKASAKQLLRQHIGFYLSYVNANILLAQHLEAGIYDWADFTPFYRDKFSRIAAHPPTQHDLARGLEKLFSILFPTLDLVDPKRMVRLLTSPKLRELRSLCEQASKEKIRFDAEFASSVLNDVFEIERKVAAARNWISWLSLPVSFVPGIGHFLHKPIEEIVSASIEAKLRKPFSWFFLMRDYKS